MCARMCVYVRTVAIQPLAGTKHLVFIMLLQISIICLKKNI